MPRQHDARLAARPECREQIGLAFIVVVGEADVGVVRLQEIADEMNQREIRVTAHRRERDELAQHLDAGRKAALA